MPERHFGLHREHLKRAQTPQALTNIRSEFLEPLGAVYDPIGSKAWEAFNDTVEFLHAKYEWDASHHGDDYLEKIEETGLIKKRRTLQDITTKIGNNRENPVYNSAAEHLGELTKELKKAIHKDLKRGHGHIGEADEAHNMYDSLFGLKVEYEQKFGKVPTAVIERQEAKVS